MTTPSSKKRSEKHDCFLYEPSRADNGLLMRDDIGQIIKTTPFSISVLGRTFSKKLAYQTGISIGEEGRSVGSNLIELPSITEFSEEEYVGARILSKLIKGIEFAKTASVVKAPIFYKDAPYSSVFLEERCLFERFIRPFETLFRECSPTIVECTSNPINGKCVANNKHFFDAVKKCGYNGLIAAAEEQVENEIAQKNGIDILYNSNSARLISPDENNQAEKLLETLDIKPIPTDMTAHELISEELCQESVVMLENKEVLPINKSYDIILVKGRNSLFAEELGKKLNQRGYNVLITEEKLICKITANEHKSIVILTDIKDELVENLSQKGFKLIGLTNTLSPICQKLDGLFLYEKNPLVLEGLAKLISGETCPSGRMAYTYEYPSIEYGDDILLKEGVFFGYKEFEKLGKKAIYPFGYGLSYTSFSYKGLDCTPLSVYEGAKITIKLTVRNLSNIDAKHSLLMFVKPPITKLSKPIKRLLDFEKVEFKGNEEKVVVFTINSSDLAYYNADAKDFILETGIYKIVFVDEKGKEVIEKGVQIFSKKRCALPSQEKPSYFPDLQKALFYSDRSFKNLCLNGEPIDIEVRSLKILKGTKGKKLYNKIRKEVADYFIENLQVKIENIDNLPLYILRRVNKTLFTQAIKCIEEG